MLKGVLDEIKDKFCKSCEVGSASLKIGYQSSGTCLDYIYDKLNVPYSFAWEIYTNEIALPELDNLKIKEKHFLKKNSFTKEELEIIKKIKPSNFLEVEGQETMIVDYLLN